ncbi:hypothetical protein, partial [Bathymodiolus platifrons methanotrophic gill symbiont]|uniref:hypothetical protein n=1 Tax=Bathymodiolus platifrons methanotrophic gill symbiont TaxID=113268 RepID=UPI001C8E9DE0
LIDSILMTDKASRLTQWFDRYHMHPSFPRSKAIKVYAFSLPLEKRGLRGDRIKTDVIDIA